VLGEERRDEGARLGTVTTILRILFRAGVRPDPEAAPTFHDDNARPTHRKFPVVFHNL
jgi:hypothetical protein